MPRKLHVDDCSRKPKYMFSFSATNYSLKLHKPGRRKQSLDGQAQLDVGGEVVNNSRVRHAAKILTLVFLAVRRHSHCTSASNWDSNAWKFSHTERKSYACVLRYVPRRILLQQFKTTQMSNA